MFEHFVDIFDFLIMDIDKFLEIIALDFRTFLEILVSFFLGHICIILDNFPCWPIEARKVKQKINKNEFSDFRRIF